MSYLELIVLITPLIPSLFNLGYEQIKALFFILSLTITGFLWLLRSKKDDSSLESSPIFIASFIFFLILLLTSLFGINFQSSFFGTSPYFQGLIFYAYLLLFAYLVSVSKINLKTWGTMLTFSSAVVSLIALYDFFALNILHLSIPTYAGRVVSTFGQPNFFAGFILINLPFINFISKKFHPFLRLGLLLVCIGGILVSLSRTSIAILAVILSIFLLHKLEKPVKIGLIAIVTTLILGSFIFSYTQSTGIIYKELIEPQQSQWLSSNSPEKRIFVWQIIFSLITQKPLQGYGLENLRDAYTNYFNKFNPEITQLPPYFFTLKNVIVDRAHNYPLDLLIFSGVGGLLSYLVLVFFLLKKVRSKILLSSLLIYLVWIQFQNQSVINLIQFWLLTGLIALDRGDNI